MAAKKPSCHPLEHPRPFGVPLEVARGAINIKATSKPLNFIKTTLLVKNIPKNSDK
tara:strand:+ start:462 stop:629 length:168 start_codon:yes stop_codon:yes gene_type:complete